MPSLNTTPYLTDAFNRGPTTAGSAAGSTTGVGNSWADRVGGYWYINSSNQLTDNGTSGTYFQKDWLVRPTSENSLYQRITLNFIYNSSRCIPIALLRVDSANDNCYAAFIDQTGEIVIAKFLNGANTTITNHTGISFTNGSTYTLDFTAVPNATSGTNLTASVYLASTGSGSPLATITVTGDTTAGVQTALTYGIADASAGSPSNTLFTAASLYTAASGPALTVTPSTASLTGASATESMTATLTGSSAALTASVSGGGTISTTTPTSGTAFTYTAPATGSGTATVTVTDSTDSLTATSTISYAAAAPAISVSPTVFPLGVATPFTITGSNTSWTSGTTPKVTGGTGAYVSNMLATGQVLTGTLNPGSATGTLTMSDSTDSATASVTASANVINNIVWHGDSLTYGQNGSNAGTLQATRLAQVMNALGPAWTGTNYGNQGHTLAQMISELGAHVNGLYNPSAQHNILVAQGGHNSLGSPGGYLTPTQCITQIQTYLAAALAANPWKIVWSTEPPAAYPGAYPYNFDQERDAINIYMRANWQALGIAALSDFALDFRMGLDGCEYNSTYYSNSDFTHPTDAGYTIWGSYDLAAVSSLFGSAQRRPVIRTRTVTRSRT